MAEKNLRILIADDDQTTRTILTHFLSGLGEIDTTVDGEEALYAFKLAYKENRPYDVICLDIMMPKFDGQDVLKKIRSFEEARDIWGRAGVKIVMVTALDSPEEIMTAFKSQCEGYVTKPIEKEDLFTVLKRLEVL